MPEISDSPATLSIAVSKHYGDTGDFLASCDDLQLAPVFPHVGMHYNGASNSQAVTIDVYPTEPLVAFEIPGFNSAYRCLVRLHRGSIGDVAALQSATDIAGWRCDHRCRVAGRAGLARSLLLPVPATGRACPRARADRGCAAQERGRTVQGHDPHFA